MGFKRFLVAHLFLLWSVFLSTFWLAMHLSGRWEYNSMSIIGPLAWYIISAFTADYHMNSGSVGAK